MKKIFTLAAIAGLVTSTAIAQPVITSSMPTAPVGYSENIYTATASVAPGSGGPAVTWNISTLTPTLAGGVVLINPTTSPYASTFPSATICAKITPATGPVMYAYEKVSSTKWETVANNYYGVGTGQDYTPNFESFLEFPFSYTNTFRDTFQKVGGSANTVDITYDGYGTLITPFATYTNVVRIQKYWGPGDYDYNWYTTSPYLGIVASYDAQGNNYVLVNNASAAVHNINQPVSVQLFPNPATSHVTVLTSFSEINNASVVITDISGKTMSITAITGNETHLDRNGLAPGIYLYQVQNNGLKVASGKIIFQ